MNSADRITTGEALKIVANLYRPVTRATLIAWARKKKLGSKVGGRWAIDKDRLEIFVRRGK